MVSGFGYEPRWSPDSTQILFKRSEILPDLPTIYVVGLDGRPPRPLRPEVLGQFRSLQAAWHPDGRRVSIWGTDQHGAVRFLNVPLGHARRDGREDLAIGPGQPRGHHARKIRLGPIGQAHLLRGARPATAGMCGASRSIRRPSSWLTVLSVSRPEPERKRTSLFRPMATEFSSRHHRAEPDCGPFRWTAAPGA